MGITFIFAVASCGGGGGGGGVVLVRDPNPPPPILVPVELASGLLGSINLNRVADSELDYSNITVIVFEPNDENNAFDGPHGRAVGGVILGVYGSGPILLEPTERLQINDAINNPPSKFVIANNSYGIPDRDDAVLSNSQYPNNIGDNTIFVFATGNNTLTDPSRFANLPRVKRNYLGNVVVVNALDNNNNVIASYSNRCGYARWWCVGSRVGALREIGTSFAAPVVSGALGYILAIANRQNININADVALAVLLTTSMDIGGAGVDNVFGWGRVDVENAIDMIRTANPNYNAFATNTFYNDYLLNPNLAFTEDGLWRLPNKIKADSVSSDLSFLSAQLNNIKTASGFGDSIQFSANLGNSVNYDSPDSVNLGFGARDMINVNNSTRSFGDNALGFSLSANKRSGKIDSLSGNWGAFSFSRDLCEDCINSVWNNNSFDSFAPAFADNNVNSFAWNNDNITPFYSFNDGDLSYQQFGFRFNKSVLDFDTLSQFSIIDEENSVQGLNFGGLARTPSAAKHFKVNTRYDNGPFGFNIVGGYETGFVDIKESGFNVINNFNNVRYDSYSIALSKQSMFNGTDTFRFNIKAEPKIISGNAVVNSFDLGCNVNGEQLTDDSKCLKSVFYQGYHLENNAAYKADYNYTHKQTNIDLSGAKRLISFNIGYAFKPSYDSVLGLAYEANTNKQSALSLAYQLNFR